MARAAVLGARGNSGMMLAHLLMGAAESIGSKEPATPAELAAAPSAGAARLYGALDDPREGTILTVAREAAAAAERAAARSPDIAEFMRQMHLEGEAAPARTPELMAVLKDAGVVDAGGIQFRVLNRRKGPAVRGPRTQADHKLYAAAMQAELRAIPNLRLNEAEADYLIVKDGRVCGLTLNNGREIPAGAVVLTTGTFDRGPDTRSDED